MSVKDLNQLVKDLLTDAIGQVWLMGEISNFSRPASGHWYFTLKDDTAQVRCAMFRNANLRTTFAPQNGQQVLIHATVTLYEARGEYQLVVDKMQPAGVGLLQQRFEQLKTLLQQEGLFETIHKKPLPASIRRVGIVTSSTGAALHDILQILKRRDPSIEIVIYPSMVQGDGSAQQIARMIELANQRAECDVLIVGRGGGSLEDLWSFNEEVVARAIFASQIPIVSAVGHEVDFTIADFVADLRAATPSAAAELISQDLQERLKHLKLQEQQLLMALDYLLMAKKTRLHRLQQQLQQHHPQLRLARQQTLLLKLQQRLQEAGQRHLVNYSQRLDRLTQRLLQRSPQQRLAQVKQRFNQLTAQLPLLMQQQLSRARHQFTLNCSQLHSVSPLATLQRGYSITTTASGQVITEATQLQPAQQLITQLKQGKVISQVTEIVTD